MWRGCDGLLLGGHLKICRSFTLRGFCMLRPLSLEEFDMPLLRVGNYGFLMWKATIERTYRDLNNRFLFGREN
jgi:hypothetical protein